MGYGNSLKHLQRKVTVTLFVTVTFYFFSLFASDVKEPDAAGTFYPDKPAELSSMIDGFLNNAHPEPVSGQIFALISPHAGYGFSGQTAAFGFKLIKGQPYKTVVVIGVSHFYGLGGISVYPAGKFRTPLGDIEIDSGFAAKLLHRDSDIIFDTQAFVKEHSVEVQLPFLQKVLSNFKIVPIIVGDTTFSGYVRLSQLLKEAIGGARDVLVIASCDMYHGYDWEEAGKFDEETLKSIKNLDAQALYDGIREGKIEFKDGFPAVALLILAKDLGYNLVKVLNYTNSAIVTGNKTKGAWTVGYASCYIDAPVLKADGGGEMMLNKAQRKKLLEIARSSIETYLKTGKKIELTEDDPVLLQEMGAFVTLREHAELRGCIGNLLGKGPLYLTVRDMAIEAAVGDPRFPAVGLPELKNIEIEISVLTPMERIDSIEKIEMGKHGVMLRRGIHSGVFLPQVAYETGWTKEEFLSNLCVHKAGLAADAWKDKSTELYIFTAEVFSEESY